MIDQTDILRHYEEFRRLNQQRVEALRIGDPEYLAKQWYFAAYEDFDVFTAKYPTRYERVEVLSRIRRQAVALARSVELAESDLYQCFGKTFDL